MFVSVVGPEHSQSGGGTRIVSSSGTVAECVRTLREARRSRYSFTTAAAREFQRKGWGRDYWRLIRQRWKGRSRDGVSLALKGLPGHTYRVGQEFDCRAFLTNEGDSAKKLNTGGTCGMTHALGIVVVAPDGDLGLGRCRGAVGGGHCFCKQTHETLQPRETVKLATGFASEAAVAWKIRKPGKHLVIGMYLLGSEDGRRVIMYSKPVVIDVERGGN